MMSEIQEGVRIGRYEVVTRIARGGMADVWLARASGASGFQKTVVIKTILPELAGDPEFVRMFTHEAIVAARLEHPNVVQIFDLGEQDGIYFIAMEYIAGRSLRHIERELRKSRRVPPLWLVLHVACMVCEALQHAHDAVDENGSPLHFVHRDISPENVMVTFKGDTKVLDFGLAKATTAVSKTRVGVLKGKYPYMSPEQIEQVDEVVAPDPRSDIYSLGVVMYELVTGHRPFRAQNHLALLRQILDTVPEPPAAICDWVPLAVSEIIMRAMARQPCDRFYTASELRGAIEDQFLSTGTIPTRRQVAGYVTSLFGSAASELQPAPAPDDVGSGPNVSESDPWALQPSSHGSEPVTIDLSMVLIEEEEDREPLSGRTPAGEHASSAAKRSSRPPPRPSVSLPAHQWDVVTKRAREHRDQRASDTPAAKHAWDAAVDRVRKNASFAADAQPGAAGGAEVGLRPAESAAEWFDRGLEHVRSRELDRALPCWRRAVELEPDNRVYQTNLKALLRQTAQRGTDDGTRR